ncbi:hypothetical protein NBH00_14875 [Paraconexibacter antarcticus]|uniref:Uncharacterized protein n=1 Tax=Paraconexibacter antarcticus TaxID=2949664 RepID=A0ABY5DP62_9ACTN|nr:hypothetical protein [Paraconexibacter antarcticus]UTI62641.1 hypothetical protein NBH00_14875 [Paraconexibacter antarcticus]
MALKFEIEMYGDKLISRQFDRISARGLDLRPAFETIGDQFRRAEANRFDTVGNGTWEALRASTVARKAQSADPVVRANHERVLVATGRFEPSRFHGDLLFGFPLSSVGEG